MRTSHARIQGPACALSAVLALFAAVAAPSSQVAAAAPDAAAAASCPSGDTAFRSEPAGEAIDTRTERAAVREANNLTAAQMRHVENDPAAWVDRCGAVFFVEPGTPDPAPAEEGPRAADAAAPTTVDVLNLSSRPASEHTIYLDFTGDTTTGTQWNVDYGATITSAPYSLNAPADTNFDAEERDEIYAAWRSVAEDFAVFDVNVTTAQPSADALTRTSSADPTYGTRVVITPSNVISDARASGGVAYLGTFAATGGERYQPAWVFSNYAGRYGDSIAQAIAHEAGHNFGLNHDGNASASYDSGADGWAPIMGASYARRVSHWSAGEYPGANNREDDVAIIATAAPTLTDDHGNTAATATTLTPTNPAHGILATRTDVDAFTFTAAGQTHLSLSGPAGVSNADLSLRILDATGQQIGASNPTRPDVSAEAAMHATWSATLPATVATYTVLVDGVGYGDPTVLGRYSDYGSLGAYTLTLSAEDPTPPLTLTALTAAVNAQVGQPFAPTRLVQPSGGRAPYSYTAGIIPSGMSFDTGGNLFGTPDYPGSQWLTVTVTDSIGTTVSAEIALTISPATPPVPPGGDTDDTEVGGADDDDDPDADDDDTAAPKFHTRRLPTARRGSPYRAVIKFTGATTVRTGRAPAGITVTQSGNRLIVRGKPKAAGVHQIKVVLRAAKTTTRHAFTLRVR